MDEKMIAVQAANERLVASERNLQAAFAAALPLGSRLRVGRGASRVNGGAEYVVEAHSYEPGYMIIRRDHGDRFGPGMKVYLLMDYLKGHITVVPK